MIISFIIIGRNIENTISTCITSVIDFIKENNIQDTEIIYVDSNSEDASIEIAKLFKVKIFKITGNVNAAIGRNVGAKNAKGEILIFIDGDMELLSESFSIFFDPVTFKLKYPYSTAHLRQKVYDSNNKFLYSEDEVLTAKSYYKKATGGFSVIYKQIRDLVNGMDERFGRNQDIDFSLRLTLKGYSVFKINEYVAIHHTTQYHDNSRLRKFITSKDLLYPGMLLRKHLFNRFYVKAYYKNLFYVVLLFLALFLLPIKTYLSIVLFMSFFIINIFRSIKHGSKKKRLNLFIFNCLYSFYTICGFLFFYPRYPIYQIIKIKHD